MSPERDDLESQLMSLRLRGVSERLRNKIAEEIDAETRPNAARRWEVRVALVGVAAVAACVLIAVIPWGGKDSSETLPATGTKQLPPRVEDLPPTVDGYRTAIQMGPEAVERILEHHATTLLPPEKVHIRVCDLGKLQLQLFGNKEKLR